MTDIATTGAPAPATETAAPATGANGDAPEVKVVVEHAPQPTRGEVEEKQRAELKGTLDAIWDKHEAAKAGDGAVKSAADRAEATSRGERPRGADGKFLPEPAKAADAKPGHNQPPEATPPVAKDTKVETTGQAQTEAKEPAQPAHQMPTSWPKSMASAWASMPPEAQQYAVQRDKEVARTIGQYGQALKAHEPLVKVLAENRDTFAGWGLPPDQAIGNLIRTAVTLDRDPVAGIRDLAKSYGVDLAQYALSMLDPSQLPPDPRISQYEVQVAALQRQIAQMEQVRKQDAEEMRRQAEAWNEHQQRQTYESTAEDASGFVQQFAAEKPDFNRYEATISRLIGPLMVANPDMTPEEALTEAYETARARDPEVRKRVVEDEIAARTKAQAEARATAARAAMAASAVNVSGTLPATGELSLRQRQDAALAEARKRYGELSPAWN